MLTAESLFEVCVPPAFSAATVCMHLVIIAIGGAMGGGGWRVLPAWGGLGADLGTYKKEV